MAPQLGMVHVRTGTSGGEKCQCSQSHSLRHSLFSGHGRSLSDVLLGHEVLSQPFRRRRWAETEPLIHHSAVAKAETGNWSLGCCSEREVEGSGVWGRRISNAGCIERVGKASLDASGTPNQGATAHPANKEWRCARTHHVVQACGEQAGVCIRRRMSWFECWTLIMATSAGLHRDGLHLRETRAGGRPAPRH